MTEQNPIPSIPVAWLRPTPPGYRIPLWRWVLLPATALMLKRNGGVWIGGALSFTATELQFIQSRMRKSGPAQGWSIPLDEIEQASLSRRMASEILEIQCADGIIKLMTARSGDFVERLQEAVSRRRSAETPAGGRLGQNEES